MGLNHGPLPYQGSALNQLSYVHIWTIWLNCKFITLLAAHLPETLYLSCKLFLHSYRTVRAEGFEPPKPNGMRFTVSRNLPQFQCSQIWVPCRTRTDVTGWLRFIGFCRPVAKPTHPTAHYHFIISKNPFKKTGRFSWNRPAHIFISLGVCFILSYIIYDFFSGRLARIQ